VAILKAVFVEANRSSDDAFLDEGLSRYDRAGDEAKRLLQEGPQIEGPGRQDSPIGRLWLDHSEIKG